MREAGLAIGVEPRHLFHTLIPPAVLYQPGGKPGIVPDATIDVALPRAVTVRGESQRRQLEELRRLFFDVKTIFAGGGAYRSARARDEASGAVAHRAHEVHHEYRRHAERLDGNHSAPGTTPIRDRLNSFTQVRALVFGNYGECSADVHHLLDACATAVARKTWQWVGARNEAEARACVLSRLRRRVGLVVVREMARHRLRRVPYIGVPRHIVEERMQPFHLRAIERGGGAAVSAADFYAFQQRQGAWGRDAA